MRIIFDFKKVLFFFIFSLPFIGLSFWAPPVVYCQGEGFKYFKNYPTKEYVRHPQNWWILQDKRGVVYVGNQGSLMEFDGISWREIDVPNKTVRSMAIDDAGTVYIGGYNELGYLIPDSKGSLQYVSLLDKIKDDKHRSFSEVWKTYPTGKGIYFQTRKFLFRWDKNSGKMKVWLPVNRFYFSFCCGGELFIRQQEIGLQRIESNGLKLVPGGETFANKKIFMMVPYDTGTRKILIGTRADGFYIYDGIKVVPFSTEADDYIKENLLYHGIRLSKSPGRFAAATLRGGLVIIDSNGKLKDIFTKTYGLQDNDVKYVFEDIQGNLWLALNNGIAKIEYHSPLSYYDSQSNLHGLVLSVINHRNKLYAGTTSGLYYLASPGEFRRVPGMPGNCWFLLSIDDSLFTATSYGVFRVQNEYNIKQRVIKNRSYVLLRSAKDKNRIWVGASGGLFSLYHGNQGGQWRKELKFAGIKQEIKTIAEDDGNLWLGTAAGGALKVDFTGDISKPDVTRCNQSHGLPPGEVHVFMAAGHVMFATGEGLFRFSGKTGNFFPDNTLGNDFAGGEKGKGVFRIVEDRHKNIWFHSIERNYQGTPRPDRSYDITSKHLLRIPRTQVNTIYPDPDGDTTWFAGNEGLIRYNKKITKNYHINYRTLIRKVLVNGKLIFDGDKSRQPIPGIKYKDRNLRFQFAAPFFEGESEIRYRCLLEGYDEQWSEWTPEAQKDYTNLDFKWYTFRVQARNTYDNLSNEAVFQFKVLPPWYMTWWAFSIYIILAALLVFLIVKWRSGRLEREKQILEQTVKERTKEINEKNRQLEKQTFQLKEQSGKLKEMDKVKSRFFANISHEFRTPLTLIMGPLEQMLSKSPGKEEEKQFNVMLRNSRRLLGLINQLLELSKFDSGKVKLQACRQNIISFLKGLVASFEPVAQKNRLNLAVHSRKEEVNLFFDPEKLEEVLFNLLSNAVKFTPAGGKITVTVDAARIDTKEENFPSGSLDILVRDTGPGIPGDQLAYIFDRFYQSDSTHEHHLKGSGIGLAIAKELVELHHGRIDVHSSVGKNSGTEFIIRLPMGDAHLGPGEIVEISTPPTSRKPPPEIQASMMEKGPAVPGTDGSGEAGHMNLLQTEKNIILVVEDSADVRDYIRQSLEPLYKVVEAKDGREGIKKALEIIPDLIISDIMMPGKNGCELCGFLKKDLKTSHVPIVLLTAKASEESIIHGLETGADDYITKPFNTKILCARIKNLIDLRCQLQQKIQRQMMLQPAEISVSSIDESFLKELRDIIEENLSEPGFDIDRLCKKLYMGRATVFRKVHALTGETPKQFIQSYRLERATQLLTDNFGNITEVAFEVGFSSSAYFTKCFKEKFHRLPSTYQAS